MSTVYGCADCGEFQDNRVEVEDGFCTCGADNWLQVGDPVTIKESQSEAIIDDVDLTEGLFILQIIGVDDFRVFCTPSELAVRHKVVYTKTPLFVGQYELSGEQYLHAIESFFYVQLGLDKGFMSLGGWDASLGFDIVEYVWWLDRYECSYYSLKGVGERIGDKKYTLLNGGGMWHVFTR